MPATNLIFGVKSEDDPQASPPINLSFGDGNNRLVEIIPLQLQLETYDQEWFENRNTDIIPASLGLSGQTQDVYRYRTVTNTTAVLELDPQLQDIRRFEERTVTMITAAMELTPQQQGLNRGRTVSTIAAELQLDGNNIEWVEERTVTTQPATLALQGLDSVVDRNRTFSTLPATLELESVTDATLADYLRVVSILPASMELDGVEQTIVYDRVVTIKTALMLMVESVFDPAVEPPLYFVKSGGPTNISPTLSLGGQASMVLGGILDSKDVFPQNATIPGVELIGVAGGPDGNHTLFYDEGLKTLRWNTPQGYSVAAQLFTDGLYYLEANSAHVYLDVTYASLPGVNQQTVYNLVQDKNPLFDDVGFGERSVDHTNYRCLYLKNNLGTAITNVDLVVAPSMYGIIEIGSEYATTGYGGLPSADYVQHNALVRNDVTLQQANPVGFSANLKEFYKGGEFLQPAANAGISSQASDGVSVEIPFTLADELDSTQQLGSVVFSNRLHWPTIDPNTYVSFWIKRFVAANTTGSEEEIDNFSLRILYED